ncbi:MAG: hypothetical protein K5860_03215 [Bacteroidales bacterium]|nr:hypothetical protein [Bacteroidales bacterium]
MKKINTLLFSLFMTLVLFANAQPVDLASSLVSTGNLVAMKKTNIEIKREKLEITLDGVYAYFDVDYTYFNKGQDDTIFWAFPVEFMVSTFDIRANPFAEDIQDFSLSVNGVKTRYDHMIEKIYERDYSTGEYQIRESPTYEWLEMAITKRWFVTKIDFPANKETRVKVKYRIHSGGEPWHTNWDPILHFGSRFFNYEFSPAQYFGIGKADEIEIILNTAKIESQLGEIREIKPDNFLKKEAGGVFRYTGKNFDFKKTPRLEVVYDVSYFEKRNYFTWNKFVCPDGPCVNRYNYYKASTMDGVQNMFDNDLRTAWCFKAGKEEFVQFDIEARRDAPGPRYISVANGYLKDRETYAANGKVTEFEVTTDCMDAYIFPAPEDMEKTTKVKPEIPVWDDIFLKNDFAPTREIWTVRNDYPLRKNCTIVVKIKNSIKGNKSDDVCISEMFLM